MTPTLTQPTRLLFVPRAIRQEPPEMTLKYMSLKTIQTPYEIE